MSGARLSEAPSLDGNPSHEGASAPPKNFLDFTLAEMLNLHTCVVSLIQ